MTTVFFKYFFMGMKFNLKQLNRPHLPLFQDRGTEGVRSVKFIITPDFSTI